uniref:Uncharacterized protein n=1 Tax=Arundo donax TaxID=35708 RepID=A0A0A9EB57_ARUDO
MPAPLVTHLLPWPHCLA